METEQSVSLVLSLRSERKGSDASIAFEDEFDTVDYSKYKGMIKAHYVRTAERESCVGCDRKFTIKLRPRHCRRCGEIFCMKCLQQQTKLNKLACPDPSGKLRKVCLSCFETCQTVTGCTRSWTLEFVHERTMRRHERVLTQRAQSLTTTFWRDQLDIYNECRRLLLGFESAVAKSKTKKAFQEMKEFIITPPWQKSPYWELESTANKCRACKGKLGVRKIRRNCKVCGLALCKKCSFRELLVFYPDQTDSSGRTGSSDSQSSNIYLSAGQRPKLAIINNPGAPSVEPSLSLLLHACRECKVYIAERQSQGQEWALVSAGPTDSLISINDQIQNLQDRIQDCISSCQRRLDKGVTKEKSNVKSKLMGSKSFKSTMEDLDGYLLDFEIQFKSLKTLLSSAESKAQSLFLKNYVKGKHDFLMDSKQTFRQLRKV